MHIFFSFFSFDFLLSFLSNRLIPNLLVVTEVLGEFWPIYVPHVAV